MCFKWVSYYQILCLPINRNVIIFNILKTKKLLKLSLLSFTNKNDNYP